MWEKIKKKGALFLMLLITSAYSQNAQTVSTYHSVSIYWSPTGGIATKDVQVEYRKAGTTTWLQGLAMKYNPIASTTNEKATYRGSLVNLCPNTTYSIRLTLQGTSTTQTVSATTWNEQQPEGTVVNVGSQTATYAINQSGTASAYRVYDGNGATIDVQHNEAYCLTIDASYVIIRGFTLKGAGITNSTSGSSHAGIRIYGGNNIIIEDCDISDWGRPNANPLVPNHGRAYEFGIFSNDVNLTQVTVQRNKIHDPTYTSNTWEQGHPSGPICVGFANSNGNHVIRYNEFYATNGNYFDDAIGAWDNASYKGFPGDDSDIYNNYVSNAWDDGIESEGGNQNVRIWNNYISNSLMAIGNAASSIGPLYVWRNVAAESAYPQGNYQQGNFLKMGYANSESYMTGYTYVFNNTIYQPNNNGYNGLGGASRILKYCISRNNIITVKNSYSHSIAVNSNSVTNDFNYDLYNKTVPQNSQLNGINGSPTYVSNVGFNATTKECNFQLAPSSLGINNGVIVPNFTGYYNGSAPDIGAHENGTNSNRVGVNAIFNPCDFALNSNAFQTNESGFNIYPNPAKNSLFITSSLEINTIKVYDLYGREVKNQDSYIVGKGIDIEDLSSGVYLLIINSNSRQTFIKE